MNNKIIKIITQTGLAGTVIVLAYLLWTTLNLIGNHLAHSTEILTKLEGTIQQNTQQNARLESAIISLERRLK